jgi:iron complex transport system permease protein
MVSFLVSSIVSLTYIFANADNVHAYVMWGMGSFSDVTTEQLPWFGSVSLLALVLAITLIKPLNALLLGDDYAHNLGINIHRTRWMILLSTGLLTAIATAYCGPVAFLGLATPHIARLMLNTSNHLQVLPVTILTGAAMALACNLICIIPPVMIPLNAVTPIFGVPVILYIIFRRAE